jgi:hypothetical protein
MNKNSSCVVYVPINLGCQYNVAANLIPDRETYAGLSLPSPVYVSTWGSNLHKVEKAKNLLVHILDSVLKVAGECNLRKSSNITKYT